VLLEGTGLNGRSSLRRVVLETGAVQQIYQLPDEYFGEGITLFGDRIYQLTWQSNTAFVYDKQSFRFLGRFSYPTEGWGLTHDGRRLIMSDGSATLFFRDPETFAETGRIDVFDENGPVTRLNELEYVRGEIWANVWQTDRVARIAPETGQVLGWIDLSGLLQPEDLAQSVDVLNGIAYDPQGDRLFVTGKLWPKLFEIRLTPPYTKSRSSIQSCIALECARPARKVIRWNADWY
jgi:glutamine cyclotransferase